MIQPEGIIEIRDSHQPFLLDDPETIWIVEGGAVDIFAVPALKNEVIGSRHHLFRAETGQALFGVSGSRSNGGVALLAVAIDQTQLRKLISSKNKMSQPLRISEWIKKWMEELSLRIPDQESLTKDQNCGWEDLQPFHEKILEKIKLELEKIRQDEDLRFRSRQMTEHLAIENAFSQLTAIQDAKWNKVLSHEKSDDALLAACQRIGEALGVQIKEPPKVDQEKMNVYRSLRNIVKASRIRIRMVLLRGSWWQEDNGPLLGFLQDGKQPIALVQTSPGHYVLYDPSKGIDTPVTRKIAATLLPYAVTFYRSFSERLLKARDVFLFALENLKREFWMIVLMGLCMGILNMLIPLATGVIFDSIIPSAERSQLFQLTLGLILVAFSTALFKIMRSRFILRMEGKVDSNVQSAVWDRLLNLPAPFFRQYSAGDLAMRANGISMIRQILSGMTLNTLLDGVFSLFNLFLLFYYSPFLAMIAMGLILIAVIVVTIASFFQIHYQRRIFDIQGKISGMVLQFLSGGIAKLRVAGAETRAFIKWAMPFAEQKKLAFKSGRVKNVIAVFYSIFPVLCTLIIFASFSSSDSASSRITTGIFLGFNAAFSAFLITVLTMAVTFVSSLNVIPIYERAKPIFETKPEVDEFKADPGKISGDVEVRHLSFRYKKDEPLILDDVSFEAKPGQFIALVGPSGSGKSTFLRLLLGFEHPDAGSIYLDGQELSGVDIRAVRQQIGVVLQNGRLMSGDIFSNIVASLPLTLEDAWEAARMAGFDKDIQDMPMQMQTIINEGASTLSGGQRQRLMIARAIVNKPKILLFDEATSALDNETQSVVSRSLENLKATRIVIAHRLSTIKKADRIYVLVKGKIVQTGNYEELIKQEGPFAELVKRQIV